MPVKKEIVVGTIRVKAKDLQPYAKTKKSWKKVKRQFPELCHVVKLFRAHDALQHLLDSKNPQFLKGQLSLDGIPQGARIVVLPTGEKLDKAYSLFATHLKIHDQDSHDHWDVLYQNKGGTFAYCYTLEKKKLHQTRKYRKVQEFEQVYDTLVKNVQKALLDRADHLAPAMYTLLKTYMRVGNEIYYKAHGHKGLTTLKKKDIMIKGKKVIFNYVAKDGVPRRIEREFPMVYVRRLSTLLRGRKADDFVFTSCRTGHPLHEHHFKKAFRKYCGREFYPHIVRSHYATMEVRRYLMRRRTKLQKEEVRQLYLSIAAALGHKRFQEKQQQWQDNYTVTINHYVQPQLIETINKRIVTNK